MRVAHNGTPRMEVRCAIGEAKRWRAKIRNSIGGMHLGRNTAEWRYFAIGAFRNRAPVPKGSFRSIGPATGWRGMRGATA